MTSVSGIHLEAAEWEGKKKDNPEEGPLCKRPTDAPKGDALAPLAPWTRH